MVTNEDLLRLLIGQRVMVVECEAQEHGDNRGCLCNLRGTVHTIEKQYDAIFAGTPSWWLLGTNKTARLSELVLVYDSKETKNDQG